MGFPLHQIFHLFMLPIWAQGPDSPQRIKHKNNETAVLGENVTIFCNLTTLADVVQITWQKIQDSLPQNIATYSNKNGERILPPYVDRLHCKSIEPNSSFITIREVTFEDEACYKCLFNVFPYGSHGGQICLNILTVSELRTELQLEPDPEGFLHLTYSAVGKPAPRMSLFPSQILIHPPEERLVQNANGTVTVTEVCIISLETVKSLGLQYLIVHMDHPLKNEEIIVPLATEQDCVPCYYFCLPLLLPSCAALIGMIIFYIVQSKKQECTIHDRQHKEKTYAPVGGVTG
ncbi:OX-2 membrane glycoprotein-like [Ochotona princeps]|uniref:OX-2 membrane glycoprotein-like n=1 Tax=Ochotona princeps TaxID=9978 RepID=UPI0027154E8C|nr:OX-2 membrane glycoprotein-like [Ochotona princeps]